MYSYFVYIRSACLNGILDGIVCSLLPVGRRERTVDDLWTSSILINKAGTQEGYTQTHTLDSRNIKGPDESLPMCVRWRCGLRLRVLSPVLCCALGVAASGSTCINQVSGSRPGLVACVRSSLFRGSSVLCVRVLGA